MKNEIKQALNNEVLSFDGDILAYIDNLSIGEQKTGGFAIKDGVASIDVKGMLVERTSGDYSEYGVTGYNIINDYLLQANDSPYVSQIVLKVDSVGGFVKGLGEVVNTIGKLKKPITTHVTGKMLSSAYWLGVSTNAIHAERGALVGSVGTYLTHTDYSEHYAKDGIHIHRFGSGKWKGAFDNRIALSDDEKSRLQAMVDESASKFMSHVAKMRGLSVDEIKSWEGDTFNAVVALEKNLIDSVGDDMNLSEALAEVDKLKAENKAKDELLAKAQAEATANAEALTAHKTKVRDEQIKALGKQFSDDEIKAMHAMDDTAFELFAKHSKPAVPNNLTQEVFTQGVQASGDDLDKAIANLK